MSRSALLRPDMNDIPSRSIRPLISVIDDPSMTWEARLEQGRPENNVGKTGFVLEYLSLQDMWQEQPLGIGVLTWKRGCKMKFFFHLRDIDRYEPDLDGMELASFSQAVAEAEKAAREMVAELVLHQDRVDGRALEVADDHGKILITVAFRDVIQLD
jgi:hypothetical protein